MDTNKDESSSPTTLQPGQSIRPVINLDQAKLLIKQYFGLETTKIKELNSYDDKNFYVEVSEGSSSSLPPRKFVLKVLNSLDSQNPGHVEAEHTVMFRLSDNGLNCSVPQKTLDGQTYKVVPIPRLEAENANISSNNDNNAPHHLIRLLTFVEGSIMHNVPIGRKLLHEAGVYIAKLEGLLKDLKLPVLESHKTIWMLGCVLELEKFIFVLEKEPERLNLVKSVLAAYRKEVEPVIPLLEKGVLHGDFNEQNILVQKSPTQGQGEEEEEYVIHGLIDFGDNHAGPYIFELAITVCYMMLEAVRCGIMDPFEAAGHVIAGYSSIRNVPEIEMKLMRTLVACRLCQSLVMGAYTNFQDPGNVYVLTTASRGWKLLDQIWNQKTDEQMVNICKRFLNC